MARVVCESAEAVSVYSVSHGSGADIDTNVHLLKNVGTSGIQKSYDSYWKHLAQCYVEWVAAVQVWLGECSIDLGGTWAHGALEILYLDETTRVGKSN